MQLLDVCDVNADCGAGLFCSSCFASGNQSTICIRDQTTPISHFPRVSISLSALPLDSWWSSSFSNLIRMQNLYQLATRDVKYWTTLLLIWLLLDFFITLSTTFTDNNNFQASRLSCLNSLETAFFIYTSSWGLEKTEPDGLSSCERTFAISYVDVIRFLSQIDLWPILPKFTPIPSGWVPSIRSEFVSDVDLNFLLGVTSLASFQVDTLPCYTGCCRARLYHSIDMRGLPPTTHLP